MRCGPILDAGMGLGPSGEGLYPAGAPELLRRRRRWFSAESMGIGVEGIVATEGVGLKVTVRDSRGPGSGAEVEGRRGVVSEVGGGGDIVFVGWWW